MRGRGSGHGGLLRSSGQWTHPVILTLRARCAASMRIPCEFRASRRVRLAKPRHRHRMIWPKDGGDGHPPTAFSCPTKNGVCPWNCDVSARWARRSRLSSAKG
ncbi:hypothetical protein FM106_02550 [Brachybacterium faecium]|nr:hypothetical protein FM106_02550 [Brachybacterium faecium]